MRKVAYGKFQQFAAVPAEGLKNSRGYNKPKRFPQESHKRWKADSKSNVPLFGWKRSGYHRPCAWRGHFFQLFHAENICQDPSIKRNAAKTNRSLRGEIDVAHDPPRIPPRNTPGIISAPTRKSTW